MLPQTVMARVASVSEVLMSKVLMSKVPRSEAPASGLLHSASCPLTFYEKKSSLSGKWRRPGVWPGAPKREIRDLGVI